MNYKVLKKRIGTSKVSLLSEFNVNGKIIDICFLQDVGILFLREGSSAIGLINKTGEIDEEWIGKKDDSRIVNGNSASARFREPMSICNNGIYGFVIEENGSRIRRIQIGTKDVTALTGDSYTEDISKYLAAGPSVVRCFADKSDVFFTNNLSNRIFKVSGNSLRQVIGDGKTRFSVSSQFNLSSFNRPTGIFVNGENIYIADMGNSCIRSINIRKKNISVVIGSPWCKEVKKSLYNPSRVLMSKGMMFILDNEDIKVANFNGQGMSSVYTSKNLFSFVVDNKRNILTLERDSG